MGAIFVLFIFIIQCVTFLLVEGFDSDKKGKERSPRGGAGTFTLDNERLKV